MTIDEIIVVEGRDDTARLKEALDCETIETHGFGISKETWRALEKAYEEKGLIILTDPDHAGMSIRKRVKERFPESKEAFLPRGKAMKGSDIGVENASPEDIREALSKVKGVKTVSEAAGSSGGPGFTMLDIISNGLSGRPDSRKKREILCEKLGIAYGNSGALLRMLNRYGIAREDFDEAIRAIADKGDKA